MDYEGAEFCRRPLCFGIDEMYLCTFRLKLDFDPSQWSGSHFGRSAIFSPTLTDLGHAA